MRAPGCLQPRKGWFLKLLCQNADAVSYGRTAARLEKILGRLLLRNYQTWLSAGGASAAVDWRLDWTVSLSLEAALQSCAMGWRLSNALRGALSQSRC